MPKLSKEMHMSNYKPLAVGQVSIELSRKVQKYRVQFEERWQDSAFY